VTTPELTAPQTATLKAADGVPIDACHDPASMDTASVDAVSVDAVSVDRAARSQALVVAHGFTGSWRRPSLRRIASVLAATGGVVSFDFRGHGRSGGASTVGDREVLDLEAAVGWARDLGYERVCTLGFSMGAAVAVRHAGLHRGVDAVAAVSGPSRWYYRDTTPMRRAHWVIERPLGRLVGRLALRTRISADGWDPVPEPPHEVAARISPTPLLIVHGDVDRYFPLEHAEKLYAAAAEPKELWIEPGFGHAETAAPEDLLRRIAAWLATA